MKGLLGSSAYIDLGKPDRKLPVQTVDTSLVMKAVEPLWKTNPETASRVRGRIEAVLDWAKVRGYHRMK